MKNLLTLWHNRGLLLRMAYKEMTDRYAGSNLGIFWAILQPLLLILLYVVVFTFVFKVRINTNGSPLDYALFAIAGLVPWLTLVEGLGKSTASIFSKASFVKQAIFPIEILPISTILPSFISLTVGIIIYFFLIVTFSPEKFSYWMFLLPVVIFLNVVFLIGMAYLLALAGVYFRDLGELIGLILTILTFATPILYVENALPTKAVFLMNFNPAAHLIYMYKDVLYNGRIVHPWSFAIFGIIAILTFLLGLNAFSKTKHLLANVL